MAAHAHVEGKMKNLGDGGDVDGNIGVSSADKEIQCKGGPSSPATSTRRHDGSGVLSTEACRIIIIIFFIFFFLKCLTIIKCEILCNHLIYLFDLNH